MCKSNESVYEQSHPGSIMKNPLMALYYFTSQAKRCIVFFAENRYRTMQHIVCTAERKFTRRKWNECRKSLLRMMPDPGLPPSFLRPAEEPAWEAGRPVLSWSLNVLALSPIVTEIVLVIPAGGGANKSAEEEQEHIRRLFIDPLPEAAAAKVRALVPGGAERYNSVYNGLEAIQWPCDYVFIHDGARPLITEEMLEKLFRAVQEYKAVVAASPSKDTVKITDDSGFVQSTPDRSRVWNIQTPQCFEYELVKSSYEIIIGAASDTAPAAAETDSARTTESNRAGADAASDTAPAAAFADFAGAGHQNSQTPRKITDDAMVVEYASDTKVRPVDTGYQNIKITTPEDLLVAEVFLRNRTERK